jgi:hypothetical protein
MSAGKVVLLVFGIIFLVAALVLLLGGGALTWATTAATDDGYIMSKTTRLESDTCAITTEPVVVDLRSDEGWGWRFERDDFVTLKVQGASEDPGTGIFIGIAARSDVEGYLDGVPYDEIVEWNDRPFGVDIEYSAHSGTLQPGDPAKQAFWEEYVAGTGTQTLKWVPKTGDWVLVIMNEDASAGVDFEGAVGARVPSLVWVGVGLLVGGVAVMIGGIVMVYFAARRPRLV